MHFMQIRAKLFSARRLASGVFFLFLHEVESKQTWILGSWSTVTGHIMGLVCSKYPVWAIVCNKLWGAQFVTLRRTPDLPRSSASQPSRSLSALLYSLLIHDMAEKYRGPAGPTLAAKTRPDVSSRYPAQRLRLLVRKAAGGSILIQRAHELLQP